MKRQERSNLPGALGAGGVVVLFCLALLWHDPLLFWNDDYELSILPVFADVARSWSEGHWPLLSPYSWVCGNLAGEFQYGTFSAFVNGAVILIWKFPLSFPQQAAALSVAHLFVLGMGGYLLARGRDLSSPVSLMVALVAALNGWIICWGATDWFGALGAFAWLPWAWWAMERALDKKRGWWRFVWPAPFVYLLITGGFPYTVLMLGLLALWLAVKACVQTRSLVSMWPLAVGVGLGLGLSAPAWLALLDYVQGSAREAGDAASHLQWRVPAAALPAFILPSWTVNWTDFSTRLMPHTATEMASGLVSPVALLVGLVFGRRAFFRRINWELGLLVIVLIISMVPSANVFRWSFRWLPFLHLLVAICAAEALHTGPESRPRSAGEIPTLRPGLTALVLVGASAIMMFILRTAGSFAFPLTWILLGIAVVWAVAEFVLENQKLRAWLPASITFASLLATYLCLPPNCGVPKYNLDQKLTGSAPLDPDRLYLSVHPAPEHAYRIEKRPQPFGTTIRPGSTSMWGAVSLINGYSPIRPSGVAREFNFAIHGEIRPDTGKTVLERESGPEGKLARLGVDGIIVAKEFPFAPGPEVEWELTSTNDEGRIFHRRGAPFPRVRSTTIVDSRPNERFAPATVSRIINGRNRLEADVTVPAGGAPALLTISRPFFNGYRASLGAVPLPVGSDRGLMPTIEVPAGMSGRLTLIYRPWWLIWGGALAGLSLFFLVAGGVGAVAARRRTQ